GALPCLAPHPTHEIAARRAVRGRRHLDDAFRHVVELELERARHDRVHEVEADHVGELEDLLIGELGPEGGEGGVPHAAELEHGTARAAGEKAAGVAQAGPAAILASSSPTSRAALQCCENTNWLSHT